MLYLIVLIFAIVSLLAVIDFFFFLLKRRRAFNNGLLLIEAFSIIIMPWLFLLTVDAGEVNDCCSGSAFFSPEHRISIYVLILLSTVAYFYSSHRKRLASPVIELLVNCLLLIGIVLNIFVAIHIDDLTLALLGNTSIGALFFTVLLKNNELLRSEIFSEDRGKMKPLGRIILKVLSANAFIKYPVLLILCIPVILLLSILLFVFSQRPDSTIKAFTETYKQGLSQLDYMCDNVQCGGHYLCSVAANGHKQLVRPERYGERNGRMIICNRQLLIANAFEQLIEQNFPGIHSIVRKNYDKVGDFIHRDYRLFRNKFFSDFVYVLMKPLEYFFLFFLYTFDRKPENRIAQQYIGEMGE